jgi:lysozyme family protein
MTFKALSKRQNRTVDPSLFSLHLIEGRVIPDWKKFISNGQCLYYRKRSVPVDVQDLPYWFCALCHRRETIMLFFV